MTTPSRSYIHCWPPSMKPECMGGRFAICSSLVSPPLVQRTPAIQSASALSNQHTRGFAQKGSFSVPRGPRLGKSHVPMSNVSGVTPTEADCCRTISNFCWSFRRHLSDSHFSHYLGELDPPDPYQSVGVTAWQRLCLSISILPESPRRENGIGYLQISAKCLYSS